jgi:hypothetical protein
MCVIAVVDTSPPHLWMVVVMMMMMMMMMMMHGDIERREGKKTPTLCRSLCQ